MCGRYATTRSAVDLAALFEATDDTDVLESDYNVAPTDSVPVVRITSAGNRSLSSVRWGLVPHWAKDPRVGARMINARAETVATSSAFAASFAKRRCLVPADGWYEWVKTVKGKQPYFMTPADGQVAVFAGLWSSWGPDKLLTCSIVTTAAVDDLALVHDRMPLLLSPDRWETWLSAPAGETLLAPASSQLVSGLELRPVGPAVGDVHNDGPDLIRRVAAPSLTDSGEKPVDLTLF
jgi:putative SOS response-associated peptidase YedK